MRRRKGLPRIETRVGTTIVAVLAAVLVFPFGYNTPAASAAEDDPPGQQAPEQQATVPSLEDLRKSLEEAWEAVKQQDLATARSLAEQVLEKLGDPEGDEEEARSLRVEALNVVARATRFADKDRWLEAILEARDLCEEAGDLEATTRYNYQLALHDHKLTQEDKDALLQRCFEWWEETGQHERVAEGLFFHGWHRIADGEFERGFEFLDQARAALKDVAYGAWHACLDATDEFRELTGDDLDLERRVMWGAGCDVAQVDDERLVHVSQPGSSCHSGKQEEMAKFTSGFWLLYQVNWLPFTGPERGYGEEKDTFSYTANPTHTRIWIEADDVSVSTPAGDFDNCLLMRATTTESPLDAEDDSRQRKLNKMKCGEKYCWLARGVGPVAYRAEREDGIVEHSVLSKFECPEQRDEWVPLVVGTRWEYVPAKRGWDFDALVVMRLTHVDGEGKYYLAWTSVGNRRDE